MIFDQKNGGFLSSGFTTDEEIFVVLNPSEKDKEKQCFLILSLFSHNLAGKLIFSLKRVSETSHLIACCFWCFQILIWCFQITLLMLYYRAKASKVLKLKDKSMEVSHPRIILSFFLIKDSLSNPMVKMINQSLSYSAEYTAQHYKRENAVLIREI